MKMGRIESHLVRFELQTPRNFLYQGPGALKRMAGPSRMAKNARDWIYASGLSRNSRSRKKIQSFPLLSPSSRVCPSIRKPLSRFGSPTIHSPSGGSIVKADFMVELDRLLEMVPRRMRMILRGHAEILHLIEIVMDLGRRPVARFPSGDWTISEDPVTFQDLEHAISLVGDFADDNRAGIDRSLHRISAIRNRRGHIIGLTCRVGRAISGTAEMVRDLVESGGSVLLIGPPGVGKTTVIREIARMSADDYKRRTVVIDTSNEIAGDGDIPHAGIGHARRMQVSSVDMQHKVMIEAVENHMPQTIVIDEIGTEQEALAASTISQRGIQLVGTAHGMTIENIIKNPSLQILVGGVQSVTLGDDEAKRRQVQKTVLERQGPPTFTYAVEILSRTECRVHHSLEATVDAILAGKSPFFEVRQMDMKEVVVGISGMETESGLGGHFNNMKHVEEFDGNLETDNENDDEKFIDLEGQAGQVGRGDDSPLILYTYEEARLVIEYIVIPRGKPVELLPRSSSIIARQIRLVESYQLVTEKSGTGSNWRLQILPILADKKEISSSDFQSNTRKSAPINRC